MNKIKPLTKFQQKLVSENLQIAKKISSYMCKRTGIDFNDLLSWSYIGLIQAAMKFDESIGTAKFSTYANYRIRGEILDEIRRYKRSRLKNDVVKSIVSIDAIMDTMGNGDFNYHEKLSVSDENLDRICDYQVLNKLVDKLTGPEKHVIKEILTGKNCIEIAKDMNVAKQYTYKLYKNAIRIMRSYANG
jgi:RNA polymerase sigma factor (sigma-70 family)